MVLARCGAEVAGIKAFWKQSYVLPRLYKAYLLKTIRMIETNAIIQNQNANDPFKKETNVAHFYIEFQINWWRPSNTWVYPLLKIVVKKRSMEQCFKKKHYFYHMHLLKGIG